MNNRYQLLYDGACPVCRREILWLYRRRPDAIEPVDTSAPGFYAAAYGLTDEAAWTPRCTGSGPTEVLRWAWTACARLTVSAAWAGWLPGRAGGQRVRCSMPCIAGSPATVCASGGCWGVATTTAATAADFESVKIPERQMSYSQSTPPNADFMLTLPRKFVNALVFYAAIPKLPPCTRIGPPRTHWGGPIGICLTS